MILASSSRRRYILLSFLKQFFRVRIPQIDESIIPKEESNDHAIRLWIEKAQNVLKFAEDNELVIAADTIVTSRKKILRKPKNKRQFIDNMFSLSNCDHEVMTGLTVMSEKKCTTQVVNKRVTFKKLTLNELNEYWKTGEPPVMAGGYSIQGLGSRFVKSILGSYSNIVGLPLVGLEKILGGFFDN